MGIDANVNIPQPFKINPFHLDGGVDVGIDPDMNTINANVGLDNIGINPNKNAINVDIGLDDIHAEVDLGLDDIKLDGKLDIGLDNINLNADLGLDDINVDLGLDDIKACVSVGIKELPKMRFHFPMKYNFCFDIFGFNIFSFGVAGESMAISENNPKKIFSTPKRTKPKGDGESIYTNIGGVVRSEHYRTPSEGTGSLTVNLKK